MKRLFLSIWIVLMCLSLAACSNSAAQRSPEDTIKLAMTALTTGFDDQEEQAVFVGANGTPVSMENTDPLAAAVGQKTTYTIVHSTAMGDTALATLMVTAPDMVSVVYAALDTMDTFDEAAFTQTVQTMLAGDVATVTQQVEVELKLVDGAWCVVMNEELSNALTGGLIKEYKAVADRVSEGLAKGGEAA